MAELEKQPVPIPMVPTETALVTAPVTVPETGLQTGPVLPTVRKELDTAPSKPVIQPDIEPEPVLPTVTPELIIKKTLKREWYHARKGA